MINTNVNWDQHLSCAESYCSPPTQKRKLHVSSHPTTGHHGNVGFAGTLLSFTNSVIWIRCDWCSNITLIAWTSHQHCANDVQMPGHCSVHDKLYQGYERFCWHWWEGLYQPLMGELYQHHTRMAELVWCCLDRPQIWWMMHGHICDVSMVPE